MGWHLSTGHWNCLRASGKHAGRKPHRLIMALLGCSYEQADDLAEGGRDLATFGAQIARLLYQDEAPTPKPHSLQLPQEFRPLTSKGSGKYFVDYLLAKRGFRKQDIPRLREDYDLRFCTKGRWHDRIIFPLRFQGRLVGWTGRSISNRERLRYLSLGADGSDNLSALLSPKEILYNYDALTEGGKALVITEGPFDALKLDAYGHDRGVRATCLFGTGITEDQAIHLSTLRTKYKRLIILGDANAQANAWRLLSQLAPLRPELAELPEGIADPGELSYNQVRHLTRRYV